VGDRHRLGPDWNQWAPLLPRGAMAERLSVLCRVLLFRTESVALLGCSGLRRPEVENHRTDHHAAARCRIPALARGGGDAAPPTVETPKSQAQPTTGNCHRPRLVPHVRLRPARHAGPLPRVRNNRSRPACRRKRRPLNLLTVLSLLCVAVCVLERDHGLMRYLYAVSFLVPRPAAKCGDAQPRQCQEH
jgi:hypothetical protein